MMSPLYSWPSGKKLSKLVHSKYGQLGVGYLDDDSGALRALQDRHLIIDMMQRKACVSYTLPLSRKS